MEEYIIHNISEQFVRNKLSELESAQKCVQSILDSLPEIYAGKHVNVKVQNDKYSTQIVVGLSAIRQKRPIDEVRFFFSSILRDIDDEIQHLKIEGISTVREISESLALHNASLSVFQGE